MNVPLTIALLAGLSTAALQAAESPHQPDDATALLLHLDGDSHDAGGAENHAEVKGNVAWVPGKLGRALSLDGTGGLVIPGSGTTYVGENSWTAECWFRPDKEQPAHAVLLSGGWGHERHWFVRLSGKTLAAGFSAGSRSGTVTSPDMSETLFDGDWHHVAAVLDRGRHGQVRLYLDGIRLAPERLAFCPPITFDRQRMGIAIGAITPWNMGKGGFRGAIDEVRVSSVVRPPYACDEPLPEPALQRLKPRAPLPPDRTMAAGPLELTPGDTLLVLPEQYVGQGNFDAAAELQRWLRAGAGVEQGFDVVREEDLESIRAKKIIALGRTQWVADDLVRGLSPAGYVLRRDANLVIVAGRTSQGTYHGAVRLLDEVCGVRFYMPTGLFTSDPRPAPAVPELLDRRSDPFVQSAMMTGILSIPGDGGWSKRNGVGRRLGGTHQHSMYAMFPPSRYEKTHPEIYPIIDGKRHVPRDANDQGWQPCLSASGLVDAAEDSALRYFRRNPQAEYVAFSVQDGHAVCQCDACRAEYARHKTPGAEPREYQAAGFSRLYWRFVGSLAERLEKRLSGKRVVALVYGPARFPPEDRLPENVILFTNFHVAELDADRILAPDPATGVSRLDYVLRRCSFYGNHDWYHGRGFLMPRIYSGYWSRFMRHLADHVEGAYMHAEAYPNWGLDGPKLYIAARLWWASRLDAGALLNEFCRDMFGPAAEPMRDYFAGLEQLWITLDNQKGPERKLFRWDRQFLADADDLAAVRRCRDLLTRAESLAQTTPQRRRIALFSKTFRLPETLYRFAAAETVTQDDLTAFWQHVDREILPDPLTLHGAGQNPAELRGQIERAVGWTTDGGKKAH